MYQYDAFQTSINQTLLGINRTMIYTYQLAMITYPPVAQHIDAAHIHIELESTSKNMMMS